MGNSRLTRLGAVFVALLLVTSVAVPVAHAAEPAAPPPRPVEVRQEIAVGDLTWEFSRRGIFADSRMVMALALLLDESAVMSAAGLSNTPLYYGDAEVRSVLDELSVNDVPPLLAASGGATPEGLPLLEQARRCRIWTPATGDSLADRQSVAAAFGAGLVNALAEAGITIDACGAAATPAEADVAVSIVGLDSGLTAIGDTLDETFLTRIVGNVTPLTRADGGSLQGGPAPAQGGNAGLSVRRSPPDVQLVAAMVALGLLLFGGRWLSGERRYD